MRKRPVRSPVRISADGVAYVQARDRARQPIDVEYVQILPLDTLLRRATCGSLPSEGDRVMATPAGFRKHPAADVSARSNDPDPHVALSFAILSFRSIVGLLFG